MSNYLHEHSRESGKESRKTRGVKRGRKGSERCNMHRETRKQPASSFFFFSLFFIYVPLQERRAFSARSNFPIQNLYLSLSLSPCGKKNPERTFHVSTNFSPIRNHSFPLPHTSNFNSSNLILEINIYLVFISIKKIRNSRNVRRGGKEMSDAFFPSPRRSATQPFLSSLPPSFCPFLAPL